MKKLSILALGLAILIPISQKVEASFFDKLTKATNSINELATTVKSVTEDGSDIKVDKQTGIYRIENTGNGTKTYNRETNKLVAITNIANQTVKTYYPNGKLMADINYRSSESVGSTSYKLFNSKGVKIASGGIQTVFYHDNGTSMIGDDVMDGGTFLTDRNNKEVSYIEDTEGQLKSYIPDQTSEATQSRTFGNFGYDNMFEPVKVTAYLDSMTTAGTKAIKAAKNNQKIDTSGFMVK